MTKTPKTVDKLAQSTFMFSCMDGPDTAPLRDKHLFGHLRHIEENNEKFRVAGPMFNEPGGQIIGSFFLVAADNEAAAWEIMQGDPYIASDMYGSVTVTHIVPACGDWMGGVVWDDSIYEDTPEKYKR